MATEKKNNETNFEAFMKELDKKKKQTVIWRIFSTVCLAVIILLIIFRALHCDCDCQNTADTQSSTYSSSIQMTDGTTSDN